MSDVVLREEEVGVLRQLSGWPGSFESAAGAAMRRMGFAGVGEFGRAQVGEAGSAFRVAPERVWVRTRDARVWEKAKEADLTLAPMLDLTGSRRVFAVSGEAGRVEEVLSRLAGVDFSGGAFEVGGFALAECMGAGVLFYRRGRGEFEVFVSRSWGESFREAGEVAGVFCPARNEADSACLEPIGAGRGLNPRPESSTPAKYPPAISNSERHPPK